MRLFIAISFPPELKRLLAAYAQALGAASERARLTREENFHLTLVFLGEALTEAAACTALWQTQSQPFKLYSDQPGRFVRNGGDICWLGLKPSPELTALHGALSAALSAQGFAGDQQAYSPHITLARQARGLNRQELPAPPRFILPVHSLTLMESAQVNGRLTYTPLYEKHF